MVSIEAAITEKLNSSSVANSAAIYQLHAPEGTPPTPFVVFYLNNTEIAKGQAGRNKLRESTLVVHCLHTRLKTLATIREKVIHALDGWTDSTKGVVRCRADYYETEEGSINDIPYFDERVFFDLVYERAKPTASLSKAFSPAFDIGQFMYE